MGIPYEDYEDEFLAALIREYGLQWSTDEWLQIPMWMLDAPVENVYLPEPGELP